MSYLFRGLHRSVPRRSGIIHRRGDSTPRLRRNSTPPTLHRVADLKISGESKPTLALEAVLSAIGSTNRWAILRMLASGNQLAVVEMAEELGLTSTAVSKQMAVLLNAGIVSVGRNRLYSMSPRFIVSTDERVVDFGWCVLRLNAG